ncbi:unnamed protein product [Caenorhabditis bovis]|uniref:Uncharacterized protein n=1 Tax=Caenorhabditis bovis TaxID=2654633 RepID=A0A8S1EIQ3_9PELO|nr:unnamed protein product [Caenorhabditis bovis]
MERSFDQNSHPLDQFILSDYQYTIEKVFGQKPEVNDADVTITVEEYSEDEDTVVDFEETKNVIDVVEFSLEDCDEGKYGPIDVEDDYDYSDIDFDDGFKLNVRVYVSNNNDGETHSVNDNELFEKEK